MIKNRFNSAFLKNITIITIGLWVSIAFANSSSQNVRTEDLRDPTTPLHRQAKTETNFGLSLTSIAKVGSRPFAIINNKTVFEGTTIGDAVVVKINAGNVVYRRNGKTHTLKIRYSVIE